MRIVEAARLKAKHTVMEMPRWGFWRLWNMSFGYFGIQVAFALQGANTSRIFQTLGAPTDNLPILWIAAPAAGLLVQPLVGHFSDRTWTRMGRRRPYVLAGAILSAIALLSMPNAGALWLAVCLLWFLNGSMNVSVGPFKAFVGDLLAPKQRTTGYAFQTAFIGAGAVAASLAPTFFTQFLHVSNVAPAGQIPSSVRYAFYMGAAALIGAVLWTVATTRETPLEGGGVRIGGGSGLTALGEIGRDFLAMHKMMAPLAVVQFFSWSALFCMWIFTTPVVAQYAFGATETASKAYNDGADWVGILFAVYNGVAALYALALPNLAARFGRPRLHAAGLIAGAIGFGGFLFIRNPYVLLLPMIGIGIAWSSILTLPYAILSDAVPSGKLGVYMGLFNIFIVLPQLVISITLGPISKALFPHAPVYAMLIAAGLLLAAALSMLSVSDTDPLVSSEK